MKSKKGYPRKAYSFERVLKDLADEISYETIEEVIDKKRSGKHIVTKCRHMIKATGDYQLVIEVVSDGLGEDYNVK